MGLRWFSSQNTKGLSWFGPLKPTFNIDVLRVKMFNLVLTIEGEREVVGERYATDLGFDLVFDCSMPSTGAHAQPYISEGNRNTSYMVLEGFYCFMS